MSAVIVVEFTRARATLQVQCRSPVMLSLTFILRRGPRPRLPMAPHRPHASCSQNFSAKAMSRRFGNTGNGHPQRSAHSSANGNGSWRGKIARPINRDQPQTATEPSGARRARNFQVCANPEVNHSLLVPHSLVATVPNRRAHQSRMQTKWHFAQSLEVGVRGVLTRRSTDEPTFAGICQMSGTVCEAYITGCQ